MGGLCLSEFLVLTGSFPTLMLLTANLVSTSWFLPELGLTAGIMLMFLLDLAWKKHPRRVLFLTVGTLFFLGLAAVLLCLQPAEPRGLFNGMIASDPFATFFKWLFLAAASTIGMQSVMIYMLVYLVMNLGAFLVVIVVAQATGSETIDAYKGLARRHPTTAIAFAICLFSLAGLPPFAGFTGKWYLFVAVLQNYALPGGGWYAALAIIGAINSAVSLYYYMRIVRAMFLDASVATVGEVSIRPHRSYQILLGAFSVALVLFGVWWNPIVSWSQSSLTFLRG
jgi:NADH:ubiquinone oxidoreductase subunit 2 (subunit N)